MRRAGRLEQEQLVVGLRGGVVAGDDDGRAVELAEALEQTDDELFLLEPAGTAHAEPA
jgi:hypothetical protein